MKRWFLSFLVLLWIVGLARGLGPLPSLRPLFDLHGSFWGHRRTRVSDQPVRGLAHDVTVTWDHSGVPHVFALDEADLYRAQGFVMASQRLFQMDLSSRATLGRLSELAGARTIERDRFFVRFGMRQAIAETLARYQADPETKQMLTSFTDGVNAYIETLERWPAEYALFGARPERFTEARIIAMAKALTFNLSGRSFALELTRLLQERGLAAVLDAYPRFLPTRLEDFVIPERRLVPRRPSEFLSGPFVSHLKAIPDFPLANPGNGSNNWAVGPSKSATGHSLFANDTHLGYSLPNIWFENQLTTPQFNVYGVALAGIPGLINGFNEDLAWGPTNGTTGVLDFFEIEFRDETSLEYKDGDQWARAEVHAETIGRSDAAAESVDVTSTRRGPLLHREGRYGLVATWPGFAGGLELRAVHALYRARTYKECLESFRRDWRAPIQNFVCADQDHVALRHAGFVPRRQPGDGRFIMDGSVGPAKPPSAVPEAFHPESIDPPEGFVLSANQKVVGPSYPFDLGWDYEEPFRGMMIRRRLNATPRLRAEDFLRLQNDAHDLQAEFALPLLLKHLHADTLDDAARAELEQLRAWDYTARAQALEPALFRAWFLNFEHRAFRAVSTPRVAPKSMRVIALLEQLDRDPAARDQRHLAEPLDEVVREAFTAARDELRAANIRNWGEYQPTELAHLARLPHWGSGPLTADGSGASVRGNRGDHGPVYKAVVDLQKPVRAWLQVPGGNEGDPLKDDYGRFAASWAAGEMREVEYDRSRGEAEARAVRVTHLKAGQ